MPALAAAASGQLSLAGWVTILVGLVTIGTVIAKAARWAGQMDQHLQQQDKTLADQNTALTELHDKLDTLGDH